MKQGFVIHPILFAIFPGLFLLANNMDQFESSVSFVPILVTACLALLAWWLLGVALKSKTRAALIVSLFLLLFFSYEEFYEEIRGFPIEAGMSRIGIRRYLLAVWGMLFALGTYLLVRTRRELRTITQVVNIMSGCLVAISLVRVGAYELKASCAEWGYEGIESVVVNPVGLNEPTSYPDIYYIIVDGYARADILEEIYEYDNTGFLDYLSSKGFFVATQSRANYCQTALSLASALNLKYLDELVERLGTQYSRRGPLSKMIHNNEVFRFLKQNGYVTVVFASGWSITDIRSADIYIAARWSPDEFQTALINMSPVPFVVNQMGGYGEYDLHRERILYTLDHLADFSQLEAPVFVFAHIIAPHPPFVFGSDGEEIDPGYLYALHDGTSLICKRRLTRDEYIEGYRDQITFINKRLESVLDAILSESAEPPIVILQADHGPGSMLDWEDPENTYFKERLSILNAYYLPNDGYAQLYDGITPVNTFRMVLNHYFGTDLELLRDESYFSTWSHPYAFLNVTDEMDPEVGAERVR